jgi:hypothetical protein
MALDGINYLVQVTQMKASNANDETQAKSQATSERRTGFDTLSQAIFKASHAYLSTGNTKLATKEKESDDSTTEKVSL